MSGAPKYALPEKLRNPKFMKQLLQNPNLYDIYFVMTHGILIPDEYKSRSYKFTVPDNTIVIQTGSEESIGCSTKVSLDSSFILRFVSSNIRYTFEVFLGEHMGAAKNAHMDNFLYATEREETLNKFLTLENSDIEKAEEAKKIGAHGGFWGIFKLEDDTLTEIESLTGLLIQQTEEKLKKDEPYVTEEEVVSTLSRAGSKDRVKIIIFLNCAVGIESEGFSYKGSGIMAGQQTHYPASHTAPSSLGVKFFPSSGPRALGQLPPPPLTREEKKHSKTPESHFANNNNGVVRPHTILGVPPVRGNNRPHSGFEPQVAFPQKQGAFSQGQGAFSQGPIGAGAGAEPRIYNYEEVIEAEEAAAQRKKAQQTKEDFYAPNSYRYYRSQPGVFRVEPIPFSSYGRVYRKRDNQYIGLTRMTSYGGTRTRKAKKQSTRKSLGRSKKHRLQHSSRKILS